MITTEQIEIFWNALAQCNRAKTQRETESIIQDAIEQYEQSKWVNVADRMPDIDVEVIVADKYTNIHTDHLRPFAGVWYNDGGRKTITHWQPLPEFKELRNESN